MAPFSRLIRFESGGKIYFSDIDHSIIELPSTGRYLTAFLSIDDLTLGKNGVTVTLDKVRLLSASHIMKGHF